MLMLALKEGTMAEKEPWEDYEDDSDPIGPDRQPQPDDK